MQTLLCNFVTPYSYILYHLSKSDLMKKQAK